MADKDLLKLGDIYGEVLSKVATINEATLSKPHQKMGKKPGKGGKDLNDKTAAHLGNEDTTGPKNADGFKEPAIDLKKKHDEDEETVEKNARRALNKFMTRKSIFDKLFESVINEEDSSELSELGIDADAGADMGDDLGGGEDDDTVTLTLDRATAQKFCDVLQSVLGAGEDVGADMGDDLGDEDLGDEEDGEDMDGEYGEEDEETLKDSVPAMTGKKNKVGKIPTEGGKEGDHTYTDTVEGGKEHNTGPAVSAMTGKNNKVKTSLKVGKSFFNQ